MNDLRLAAAATIQAIAEAMVDGADARHREGRRWNPAYIRRQGRRLLAALETLTEEENADGPDRS